LAGNIEEDVLQVGYIKSLVDKIMRDGGDKEALKTAVSLAADWGRDLLVDELDDSKSTKRRHNAIARVATIRLVRGVRAAAAVAGVVHTGSIGEFDEGDGGGDAAVIAVSHLFSDQDREHALLSRSWLACTARRSGSSAWQATRDAAVHHAQFSGPFVIGVTLIVISIWMWQVGVADGLRQAHTAPVNSTNKLWVSFWDNAVTVAVVKKNKEDDGIVNVPENDAFDELERKMGHFRLHTVDRDSQGKMYEFASDLKAGFSHNELKAAVRGDSLLPIMLTSSFVVEEAERWMEIPPVLSVGAAASRWYGWRSDNTDKTDADARRTKRIEDASTLLNTYKGRDVPLPIFMRMIYGDFGDSSTSPAEVGSYLRESNEDILDAIFSTEDSVENLAAKARDASSEVIGVLSDNAEKVKAGASASAMFNTFTQGVYGK
jgi:hypothetical protein